MASGYINFYGGYEENDVVFEVTPPEDNAYTHTNTWGYDSVNPFHWTVPQNIKGKVSIVMNLTGVGGSPRVNIYKNNNLVEEHNFYNSGQSTVYLGIVPGDFIQIDPPCRYS